MLIWTPHEVLPVKSVDTVQVNLTILSKTNEIMRLWHTTKKYDKTDQNTRLHHSFSFRKLE